MAEPAALHPNARAVADVAQRRGIAIDVREFPEGTRTAADAAAAIGVDVAQIVKSLVFTVDAQVVIALVSGPNRLDEARLALAAGGGTATATVGRADAETVRTVTGYPIGGVPPFAHRTPLPTFLDRTLLDHPVVWAAAGTPRHVFAITPADLLALSRATPADLAG